MTRLDDIEARLNRPPRKSVVGVPLTWAEARDLLKIARAAERAVALPSRKPHRARPYPNYKARIDTLRAALEAVERSDTEAIDD